MEKHLYPIKNKNKTVSLCRQDPSRHFRKGSCGRRTPTHQLLYKSFTGNCLWQITNLGNNIERDGVFKDEKTEEEEEGRRRALKLPGHKCVATCVRQHGVVQSISTTIKTLCVPPVCLSCACSSVHLPRAWTQGA